MTSGIALAAEQPLLLDPCADHPTEHLVFADNGYVTSRSERGRVTIEVLGLNRDDLTSRRRQLVERIHRHLAIRNRTPQLKDWTDSHQPYAATARQVLYQWAAERGRDWFRSYEGKAPPAQPEQRRVAAKAVQRPPEAYSVESPAKTSQEAYYTGARRIERIEIHNWKVFERLDIVFPEASSEQEPWLMLLGENGTGKSSVLKGVALALMGDSHANSLGLDARTFVRRGTTGGFIQVHLSNLSGPIKLEFNAESSRFAVAPPEPTVLLLGYGATRLLRHTGTPHDNQRYVRVKNLFDPTTLLDQAESWLVDEGRVDQDRFDEIALTLKDLLMLDEEDRLIRENGRVYVRVHGVAIGFEELSDGFQSVVALALDIMMALFERWPSMKVAEGVVLLDEIEVHLHPAWKIEIVGRLRRCFPRVTFLATTHDPLCLKGLLDGEIAVLRRDSRQRVSAIVHLPSVEHLRADQILTSPLFGLASTRGETTVEKVDRYADLYRLGRARSPEQEQEFRGLETELEMAYADGETPAQRRAEALLHQAILQAWPAPDPGDLAGLAPDVRVELKAQLEKLLTS
jgi:hypothetical protein